MTVFERKPFEILPYTDPTAITIVIHDEDHTLGNALSYVMNKRPDVDFCAYSIPHPTENKMHFRIQSRGRNALDVLKDSLKELNELCLHVEKVFTENVPEPDVEM